MQTPANTQLFHEGRAENIISSCFAKRALESVTQIAKRPLGVYFMAIWLNEVQVYRHKKYE